MHNLAKIKSFRILLRITYPLAVLFVYPLVLLKKRRTARVFFFFDRYVIGGAQRVHLDILNSLAGRSKEVYFTRRSANDGFKKEFYSVPGAACHDIHFWCDNLLLRLFSVHYYAFYLNRHRHIHVFSSNSTFFYDLLPFLNPGITKTELLHNFTYGKEGMEFFGLSAVHYLDHRILVDYGTFANLQKQYVEYGIPSQFLEKVQVIEPGVLVPSFVAKKSGGFLNVLYAGRGGPQKRIHLIDSIATYFIGQSSPVKFHFAGTMANELSSLVKSNSVLHGEIRNPADMGALYTEAHAILMTSSYEGFPMLIKEGMAHGCVPVVTALEGNKSHLENGRNALLIEAVEDEAAVIQLGILQIKTLLDREWREKLSFSAWQYAGSHFSKTRFIEAYKNLLAG